jgi:hypothetical protein
MPSVPVYKDIDQFITKADLKLIRAAQRRGGDAAAKKMIDRISKRVGRTTFDANEKISADLKDDIDRAWPDIPMLRPVKRRGVSK